MGIDQRNWRIQLLDQPVVLNCLQVAFLKRVTIVWSISLYAAQFPTQPFVMVAFQA